MRRRHFLTVFFFSTPFWNTLFAFDYRKYYPKAWTASTLNEAALALYGKEKFLTLQKSDFIELSVPSPVVEDRENILIGIESSIHAKTVAIFQDSNQKSLLAVFEVTNNSIIAYEISIRMAFKGTLFAVVEGLDGKLYYTRKYIDILTLSCMAS